MARKKQTSTIEPTVEETVYTQLPDIIVVGAPLVDVVEQVTLFTNAAPGRYTLQYSTYGSTHIVGVYWDGSTLTL